MGGWAGMADDVARPNNIAANMVMMIERGMLVVCAELLGLEVRRCARGMA